MGRVPKALRRVDASLEPEAVHRLRVALRRCRSLAALMEEVDPHPDWAEMRGLSRKLFRRLGALRDTQVLEDWITKLTPADDAVRAALMKVLEDREVEPRASVRRAVRQFDRRAWKRLTLTLDRRARLVPPNGLVAQCLALQRYEELHRLHIRAIRTERPTPWHELRVSVKRFRYAVESLLPARLAVWAEGLRHMQDLLGEIHDLDVLDAFVAKETVGMAAEGVASLRQAIGAARHGRLEEYRQATAGSAGLLQVWRAALPQGARIGAAATARLAATARALDRHPRRTARVSRLALRLFDALVGGSRQARGRDKHTRVILRAAAQLHGIRGSDRHTSRQEAARDILRAMSVPPGWTSGDWEMLTLVVRYHRGGEPTPTHAPFARLHKARQEVVRRLAGVLRVARALDRCGAASPPRVRVEETPVGVRLRVAGLIDSREHAARLAAAKHLLETSLRRPLLIEALDEGGASSPAAGSVARRRTRPLKGVHA
jgi:CHAD domain-containing protein